MMMQRMQGPPTRAPKNRVCSTRGFRHSAGSLVLFLVCLWSQPLQAFPLKLVTWNLNWLTLQPDAADLPPDIPPRTPHDFQRLRFYAQRLQGDVIVLEEVASPEAIWQVFDKDLYQLYMTGDPVAQHVALLVRRTAGLTVNRHPDVSAIATPRTGTSHPLRSGLDVTLTKNGQPLRLLGLHLKSGCWARPLTEKQHACPILYDQFHEIENWILDREDAGEAYVLLGDFNRQLTPDDPLMKALEQDAPLLLATSGHASPCYGGRRFIDHLLLGGTAKGWMQPGSLRVMVYGDADRERALEGLSDHCPVSIKLSFPENPL